MEYMINMLCCCLWLFVIGSLLGVILEGIWWRYRYGFWQTHTTLLWSPFCTIYGFGCAGCYIGSLLLVGQPLAVKFIVFGAVGMLVELVGGALVYYGLGMRAWDYSETFMNLKGFVNLKMALVWGFYGCMFQLLMPAVNRFLAFSADSFWQITAFCIALFVAVDTVFTSLVLYRWSRRHRGMRAESRIARFIDRRYPDEKMQKRFNNWYFVDTGSVQDARTKPKAPFHTVNYESTVF